MGDGEEEDFGNGRNWAGMQSQHKPQLTAQGN